MMHYNATNLVGNQVCITLAKFCGMNSTGMVSEQNKQMSALFKSNTKYIDESISAVEVEVRTFLRIGEVEGNTVFLNNGTTSHRGD